MNVLLIRPPVKLSDSGGFYITVAPPLGVGYIASFVRERGFDVWVLDAYGEGWGNRVRVDECFTRVGLSDDDIRERVRAVNPDVVGITNLFTNQVEYMFHAAKLVKEVNPSACVVVGGAHPSSLPLECFSEHIDFVVSGEGELPFLGILESISGERNIESVKNIYYTVAGEVVYNGGGEGIRDLDSIPYPAYDLLPMESYREAGVLDSTVRGGHHSRYSMVVSSRGCPYRCCFCSVHLLEGRVWRGRSPEDVVGELILLNTMYGVSRFSFEDSNFTYDMGRVERICDLIVDSGLNLRWTLPNGVRADKITPRLVGKMRDAGCVEVTVAVEHGSQEFLDRVVHKNICLNDVEDSVRTIVDAGLPVSGFFILGIPPEDKYSLNRTYWFAVKLARFGMIPQINFAIPLPGTELARECVSGGYLGRLPTPDEYLSHLGSKPLIPLSGVSGGELVRFRNKMFLVCALTLLLYHPILFFRFPFVRQSMRDLLNPSRVVGRVGKILCMIK